MKAGTHMIVDLYGCTKQPYRVVNLLARIAKDLGLTVLDKMDHRFGTVKKNGETAVLLLAESHMSVHSWPERKYVAFDLFSCQEIPAKLAGKAAAALVRLYGCKDYKVKVLERGK